MPRIDDTDSSIAYGGSWSVDGGLHSTTSVGSTATIRFTGTSIKAYFTNPAGSGELQATFTLDGRDFSFTRHRHYVAYENDCFFDSRHDYGDLSQGAHTLAVRNTGTQGPLLLDYFDVEGTVVQPVAIQPPPSPTPTPQRPTTQPGQSFAITTQTQTVTEKTTAVATSSPTSAGISSTGPTTSSPTSGSSSTQTSSSTSTRSVVSAGLSIDPKSGQTVTNFQVVTTTYSGVGAEVTLYPDGSGNFRQTGAVGKRVPVGALVGAIVGGLAVLLLLGLLVLLFLRRRRRDAAALAQSGEDKEGRTDVRENGTAASAFSARPFRMSESLRSPSGISKLRTQRHNRGFSRLEDSEVSETIASNTVSTADREAGAPTLSLTPYANGKDVSLTDSIIASGSGGAALSEASSSAPSPLVSEGYAFSERRSYYDVPPPAYHSGRASSLYPGGDVRLSRP